MGCFALLAPALIVSILRSSEELCRVCFPEGLCITASTAVTASVLLAFDPCVLLDFMADSKTSDTAYEYNAKKLT